MESQIVIIKYNAGNIRSVVFALNRLGVEPLVTDDQELIRKAEKVIFPGVGEASTTMDFLRTKGLSHCITSLRQPVLGICLGLQLMCLSSEEGNAKGLGIFDATVKRFPEKEPNGNVLKVPHMGWNCIENMQGPLFRNLSTKPFVYFVHSYYAEMESSTVATTNYGLNFSAALQKDNFFAVQFHPEKSGSVGEIILQNFLKL